jgi:CheY-like chemotaxis protein
MMKLLAVDDDPVFLAILVPMLGALGHKDVTVSRSAGDALAKLQDKSLEFDCILMDIQMPGMSGVELCEAVRSIPAYHRTPIMMITAMSGKRFIDNAFSVGATDFITKPLDRVELTARLGMVERLLTERRLFASLEHRVEARGDGVMLSVEFETALPIPGFDRGIEYLALENYLLTLGNKPMHQTSAIAFHIQNAVSIYRRGNMEHFIDMLADVATAISDAVKTDEMMLAYAGSGNFVGVLTGNSVPDSGELEVQIQAGVAEFASFYAADRIPLPQVKVGQLVKASFFGRFHPTRLLERAIQLAGTGPEPKSGSWWKAA